MPHVLVVDHHDSYTWNLVHLIASVTGDLPEVREHDEPDLLAAIRWDPPDYLVLSPGPGHPGERADFALGPAAFVLGVPVLGVCLGMQALVSTCDGTVERVTPAHGEVAVIEHDGTGIFTGIPNHFDAVRYHSLAATAIPDVLRVTATSDGVVMGVQHRDLPLHGVQFHPESILSQHGRTLIENFLGSR